MFSSPSWTSTNFAHREFSSELDAAMHWILFLITSSNIGQWYWKSKAAILIYEILYVNTNSRC